MIRQGAAAATPWRLIAGGLSMEGRLRVLILEDMPADAELMQHALRRAGVDFEALCVDDREAFGHELSVFNPDIVLADYHLPSFTGLEAVQIVRRDYPQIPVVIVTGTLGDLSVAEVLKAGARDYVLKDDLERLPHAVHYSLSVEQGILARKAAEETLRARETFYHTILEDLPDLICRWQPDGTITYVNDNYCRYFGRHREALLGHRFMPVIPEEEQPQLAAHRAAINTGKSVATIEYRVLNAEGKTRWQRWVDRPLLDAEGNIREIQSTGWDIHEQKEAAEKIQNLARFPEENPSPVLRIDRQGQLLYANPAGRDLLNRHGSASLTTILTNAAIEAIKTQQPATLEQSSDGHIYAFQVAPVIEAGYANFYGRDVTGRRLTENLIRQERDRAQRYLDIAGVIMLALDREGRITLINRMGCEILGYTEQELLGRSWFDYLPEGMREAVSKVHGQIVTGNSSPAEYHENPVVCRDGRERLVAWHNTVLTGAGGEVTGSLSSGDDITERRRLEQLGLESEIANRMAEGVQLTRVSDGLIVYTNPSFEQMFGYAPEELLGQHIAILNASTDQSPVEGFAEISATLKEHGTWEGDIRNRRKDGSEFWCHATVSTFDHPEHGQVWLAVHLDITERKEVERLKDELVSTVSHELRTPLTTMLGFVELLHHREMPREREQELLAIIEQEGQRLTRLLNDFLDIQRLESGRQEYHLQALDISGLLREALTLYAASTTRHTLIDALPAGLLPVNVDPDRLRQVLDNLIFNAIKYSPAGGEITLGARNEPDQVVVSVADQGMGIPHKALERLFSKFYRVESAATEGIGGTGLGLTLVKEIIEAHRGRVWVESEPGKGSVFSFSLPLATRPGT